MCTHRVYREGIPCDDVIVPGVSRIYHRCHCDARAPAQVAEHSVKRHLQVLGNYTVEAIK